jgi:hypothetical protein
MLYIKTKKTEKDHDIRNPIFPSQTTSPNYNNSVFGTNLIPQVLEILLSNPNSHILNLFLEERNFIKSNFEKHIV